MAIFTYKDLLRDSDFLKCRIRARQLMRNGTDLIAIKYSEGKLLFRTASGTYGKKVMWMQEVEISDATLDNILNREFKDVDDLLRNSGLKVHCSCPSYLYWGYKYMAWKRGYGLQREMRRPKVRNPHERGRVCFTEDAQVLTTDGYKRIKDVNPGDLVLTHKGRFRRVIATSSRFVDETIKIRVGNKWLTSTIDHPYLACPRTTKSNPSTRQFDPSRLEWTDAVNLDVGGYTVTPYVELDSTIQVENKIAFMLGLYLGDGNLNVVVDKSGTSKQGDGKFRCKNLTIALDALNIDRYQSIFNSYGILGTFKIQEHIVGRTGMFYVQDSMLKVACLRLGNFTSSKLGQHKILNTEVLSWNKEAQKELLKGFFLADGTIVNGGGTKCNHSVYVTLFNTNKQIIETIAILLKQWFDIKVGFYDRKDFEEYGHTVKCKRIYYIRLTGEQCKEFCSWLGEDVLSTKGGYRSVRFTEYKKSDYLVNGVRYSPKIIKAKEMSGGAVVYNLEVEEDNSYTVNDIAVHNCKHLYLVLSLYPFWIKPLAQKFRKWADSKEVNSTIKNLERARMNRYNRNYVDNLPPEKSELDELEEDLSTYQ